MQISCSCEPAITSLEISPDLGSLDMPQVVQSGMCCGRPFFVFTALVMRWAVQ